MKQHAPSAERNRDEILAVLRGYLPQRGVILEIASGTGQHAVHFAPHAPQAAWQPTDRRPEALASIKAWAAEAGLDNLREPLELDVTWPRWPVERAEMILTINMLHISPWSTCEAWLAGAARALAPGGRLVYYGAFLRADRETAPSNLAFDRSLRDRDPAWGVRQLEEVLALGEELGLRQEAIVDMPNNNTLLVLKRA
jgi:SAM-dependent methyltransferase